MIYLEIGATRVEERDRRDPHKRRNIWKSGSASVRFSGWFSKQWQGCQITKEPSQARQIVNATILWQMQRKNKVAPCLIQFCYQAWASSLKDSSSWDFWISIPGIYWWGPPSWPVQQPLPIFWSKHSNAASQRASCVLQSLTVFSGWVGKQLLM